MASEHYAPNRAGSAATASIDLPPTMPVSSNNVGGNNNCLLQTQDSNIFASLNTSSNPTHRVLFAVQGARWLLELEKICITSAVNDRIFFKALREIHQKHYSRMKYFFSPFRFRFCKFVKFERFDVGRVISRGEDLPDYHGYEHDYDYTPRPGEIPPIDPQTFAICLLVCDTPCVWSFLSPRQDCIRLPPRSNWLQSIPKKKSDFNISSEEQEYAWGIKAEYALSFVYLATYHLVPILAAFGVCIYWLVNHPGDWQNAAVPILTLLALMAVFWLPFAKHLGMSLS